MCNIHFLIFENNTNFLYLKIKLRLMTYIIIPATERSWPTNDARESWIDSYIKLSQLRLSSSFVCVWFFFITVSFSHFSVLHIFLVLNSLSWRVSYSFKWTWTRLGPIFVYKNYLTWNSNRILTESRQNCTNHFGKDWTIKTWNHSQS